MGIKNIRTKGFVIGSDLKGKPGEEQTVWKVRVKDERSEYNGEKIWVASVRDNIELANGLEVAFILVTIGGHLKALDVRPDTQEGEKEVKPMSRQETETDSIRFYVSEMNGKVYVYSTGLWTEDEARKVIERESDGTEKFISFIEIPIETDGDFAVNALMAINTEQPDSILHSVEKICNRIFQEGRHIENLDWSG